MSTQGPPAGGEQPPSLQPGTPLWPIQAPQPPNHPPQAPSAPPMRSAAPTHTPPPSAPAQQQPPPPRPPAGTGRKRRGRLLVGLAVVIAAVVAVAAIVVVGTLGEEPAQRAAPEGPADSFAEAPKCDGFSPEVRETLPDSDASLNQPMAGTAGGSGYRCLWIASGTEVMVTSETLTASGGRTGAARAAEWIRDLPGDALTDPKIGDAAKLDADQCDLTFHLSNLVVDIIGGKPGSCRQRLVELASDYADANKR